MYMHEYDETSILKVHSLTAIYLQYSMEKHFGTHLTVGLKPLG